MVGSERFEFAANHQSDSHLCLDVAGWWIWCVSIHSWLTRKQQQESAILLYLIAGEHPLFTVAERPLDPMYQRNIFVPVRRGQEPLVLANGDTVLNANSDMTNFRPDPGWTRCI